MALLQMHFMSKMLNRQTTVTIILPQTDQNDLENWKSQTLWLLHGMQGDASDWLRFTSIERYAERNHLMVVMPGVDNSFYSDTVYQVNYWSYLTVELWQMVRAWFPCFSERREDNFIAGLSMGAGGAMKYAVNFPQRFSQGVCLSGGSLTMEDLENLFFTSDSPIPELKPALGSAARIRGTSDDVYAVAKQKISEQALLPSIHFWVGGADPILWSVQKAHRSLQEAGWPVTYRETPGYGHEWAFWDMAIRETEETFLPLKKALI